MARTIAELPSRVRIPAGTVARQRRVASFLAVAVPGRQFLPPLKRVGFLALPFMSYAHQNEFTRIEGEFEDVKELLEFYVGAGASTKKRLRNINSDNIESALATANDAYALLLIATAERFLRAYLTSQGILLPEQPTLDRLINQCCKVFNATRPQIPIRTSDAREMHDLRDKRNQYAHGQPRSVFPSVRKVAVMLGRFFDHLP